MASKPNTTLPPPIEFKEVKDDSNFKQHLLSLREELAKAGYSLKKEVWAKFRVLQCQHAMDLIR
jgi:hypothetical protein